MNQEDRRRIRLVVHKVHPDRFSGHAAEAHHNSESLKVFNSYIHDLVNRKCLRSATLTFYVKEAQQALRQVTVTLPRSGCLKQLFVAFGLIDENEANSQSGAAGQNDGNSGDSEFVSWLANVVAEAAKQAEHYEALDEQVSQRTKAVKEKFGLEQFWASGLHGLTVFKEKLEAVDIFEQCLDELMQQKPDLSVAGLSIALDLPKHAFRRSEQFVMDDDGDLRIFATPEAIRAAFQTLDVQKAKELKNSRLDFDSKVSTLKTTVKAILSVVMVREQGLDKVSDSFVRWMETIVEYREKLEEGLEGRKFSFWVKVKRRNDGPSISFCKEDAILLVRPDCSPDELLQFLTSEAGQDAESVAVAHHQAKAETERLLREARATFGVTAISTSFLNLPDEKVAQAAIRRFLEHSEQIKQAADLKGMRIVFGKTYEVWESGTVSVPHDFEISHFLRQMPKMLTEGSGDASGRSSAAGALKIKCASSTCSRDADNLPAKRVRAE